MLHQKQQVHLIEILLELPFGYTEHFSISQENITFVKFVLPGVINIASVASVAPPP